MGAHHSQYYAEHGDLDNSDIRGLLREIRFTDNQGCLLQPVSDAARVRLWRRRVHRRACCSGLLLVAVTRSEPAQVEKYLRSRTRKKNQKHAAESASGDNDTPKKAKKVKREPTEAGPSEVSSKAVIDLCAENSSDEDTVSSRAPQAAVCVCVCVCVGRPGHDEVVLQGSTRSMLRVVAKYTQKLQVSEAACAAQKVGLCHVARSLSCCHALSCPVRSWAASHTCMFAQVQVEAFSRGVETAEKNHTALQQAEAAAKQAVEECWEGSRARHMDVELSD